MINVLRKNSRWLWFVIALLAIPFVFYFNKTDFSATRASNYGKLYGRTVSNVEIERGERMFDLARDLGFIDLLQDLIGGAQTEAEAKEQFAINLLVLRHEADALAIHPSDAEVASAVSNLRAFRGTGGFDLKKYNDAVQNYLGPRGFSEAQMEELAADQVALSRLKEIIGMGATVSETESKKGWEQAYAKFEVELARVKNAEVANEVKITDADVAKYYEGHKDQLKSEEKRRVQLVALTLDEQQKKLTGKDRIDALQALADKANDVSQALSQKNADFTAAAAKWQLPVITTGDFTPDKPDPQLKDPQLAEATFQLTKEEPTSEPLQNADGFYILHLAGITPAQPLTLEQAKPQIMTALKAALERELVGTRAAKLAHDLREALQKGEPLATAAQRLNVKLEKLPPFALADEMDKSTPAPDSSPDLPMVKRAVAELQANDVTEPLPTNDGMLVAAVAKRTEPNAAQAAQRRMLDERILRGKQSVFFYEWLRERRRAAGVVERPPATAS